MLSSTMPKSCSGMVCRITWLTWSGNRAVSSMRRPVLARRCSRIWPASTAGEKIAPEQERKAGREHAKYKETCGKQPSMLQSGSQGAEVARAKSLKSVFKSLLVASQKPHLFALVQVGTDIRLPRSTDTWPSSEQWSLTTCMKPAWRKSTPPPWARTNTWQHPRGKTSG